MKELKDLVEGDEVLVTSMYYRRIAKVDKVTKTQIVVDNVRFRRKEECWQEMLKHQPFGVVKDKYFANYQTHRAFTCLVTNGCHFRGYEDETFENSFKNLLFADGTPFGVKVEK